jgi:hypothetical protein
VAASTGTSFTLPILLNIAARVQKERLPVKRIVFLWIVKNRSWTSWISSELTSAAAALRAVGVELSIRVHVTCDQNFAAGQNNEASMGCFSGCNMSLDPCCCETVDEKDQSVGVKDAQISMGSRLQSSSLKSGMESSLLSSAEFHSGRPDFYELLWSLMDNAEGETGVAVCGPLGLSSDIRKTVVKCSDERAVHKGSGAQGVYLHAECFGW